MEYGQELQDFANHVKSECTKFYHFAFSISPEKKDEYCALVFITNKELTDYEVTPNFICFNFKDIRSKKYIEWINEKKDGFSRYHFERRYEIFGKIEKLKTQKNDLEQKIKELESFV